MLLGWDISFRMLWMASLNNLDVKKPILTFRFEITICSSCVKRFSVLDNLL